MKEISGERYREILRYIIALEEAEDFSNAVIELLRYVILYDATLYIQLDRRGLLVESHAVTPGVEIGASRCLILATVLPACRERILFWWI